MKTGYPFLRISQLHNIPYETVLMAADYACNMESGHVGTARSQEEYAAFNSLSPEAVSAVNTANDEMRGMSLGLFDWQTGHHVKEAA